MIGRAKPRCPAAVDVALERALKLTAVRMATAGLAAELVELGLVVDPGRRGGRRALMRTKDRPCGPVGRRVVGGRRHPACELSCEPQQAGQRGGPDCLFVVVDPRWKGNGREGKGER